jgi:thiamine biosynthesis lipoprotein
MSPTEQTQSFDCFGSSCSVLVSGGRGGEVAADRATRLARCNLEQWHARFSRFLDDSELCRLNGDPRETVPVSAPMARLAQAVVYAGSLSGGLVDGTLLDQIEAAGYVRDLRHPLPLATALELAPARKPAAAPLIARWREIEVDVKRCTLTRPRGVKLDSGGLAKGLFADLLAETLAGQASFAIDCAGDLAVGGVAGEVRAIRVESPFDGSTLHTFHRSRTGVATSGIGRRSWLDRDGRLAHHLLDPATGRPAFTGVVQATALAPSALLAEIYAKAAVLSGPRAASAWLRHGGVLVFDDGSHRVITPARTSASSSWTRSGRLSTSTRHNARDARHADRLRDGSRDRAPARGGARA